MKHYTIMDYETLKLVTTDLGFVRLQQCEEAHTYTAIMNVKDVENLPDVSKILNSFMEKINCDLDTFKLSKTCIRNQEKWSISLRFTLDFDIEEN